MDKSTNKGPVPISYKAAAAGGNSRDQRQIDEISFNSELTASEHPPRSHTEIAQSIASKGSLRSTANSLMQQLQSQLMMEKLQGEKLSKKMVTL